MKFGSRFFVKPESAARLNIKAQESGYDGAMGSGDIAGAMDSFAGNWDYHRGKLVGSMQALGEVGTKALSTLSDNAVTVAKGFESAKAADLMSSFEKLMGPKTAQVVGCHWR